MDASGVVRHRHKMKNYLLVAGLLCRNEPETVRLTRASPARAELGGLGRRRNQFGVEPWSLQGARHPSMGISCGLHGHLRCFPDVKYAWMRELVHVWRQLRIPVDVGHRSIPCGPRLRHVGHDYGETENAAHIRTESRPTSHRNQWPTSNGITGPHRPEYAYRLIPDPSLLDQGQIWSVAGSPSVRESIAENGFKISETQINATAAQLLRSAGRNIIAWIAECPDAAGVGQVKARKLYERFGPSLIELIEQKNIPALAEIIKQESAELLCQAFEKHEVASTLLWLDQIGMPRRIGASALAFYKNQAREKIEANPYILLSFEADWAKVDDLARNRMGIAEDDSRRLLAGIEESLYRGLNAGHTCLPRHEVKSRLSGLLGTNELANQALEEGLSGGQFLQVGDYYQLHGSHLMESYIARRLMEILAGESAKGQKGLFNQSGRDLSCLEKVIDAFEIAHSITLSPEQRTAVLTSAGANLSLILGGAGTGKTTVLKALFAAIDALEPGTKIIQLALAGLAAQRMTAATGRESMTIAGFLAKVDPDTLDFDTTIVLDEASMIDVILL